MGNEIPASTHDLEAEMQMADNALGYAGKGKVRSEKRPSELTNSLF